MNTYFTRRLLLLLPTLALVSLLAFWMQEQAPGDPVRQYLHDQEPDASRPMRDQRIYELAYLRAAHELGMDRPAFYFSIHASSTPDTACRILPLNRREAFLDWCAKTGDPAAVQHWYDQLNQYQAALLRVDPNGRDRTLAGLRTDLARLPLVTDPDQAMKILASLPDTVESARYHQVRAALPAIPEGVVWRNWIPTIQWHGTDNRYHRWITSWIGLTAQRSWVDGQPIWRKIGQAARWTLLMNGLAILLAYGLSIPLGVWMARHAGSARDQWTTLLLYTLYSIPGFWLGTLLLVFLTTPEYGLDIFPSIGLGDLRPDDSGWDILITRTSHLFLPVFCLTYGSLAYLTRHVRNAMLHELKQDYIRAAWARGLSERQVIWRHAFRNALFPLITLFGAVLPAALAGSVAIEVIFNIPGMGRLTYASIVSQDWPVVYGVLFLAAMLTLAGSLLADLLYSRADPRVRWQR
ncbi:MAG: ABC transporter permease [Lewinellaceae bacterium]|nr:ABC transporter permease [Saprospiraceae bacterium]MCB9311994.1 ABC transporter permease [Lewinellaceae bacterium]